MERVKERKNEKARSRNLNTVTNPGSNPLAWINETPTSDHIWPSAATSSSGPSMSLLAIIP
jgi:hypothetical protein